MCVCVGTNNQTCKHTFTYLHSIIYSLIFDIMSRDFFFFFRGVGGWIFVGELLKQKAPHAPHYMTCCLHHRHNTMFPLWHRVCVCVRLHWRGRGAAVWLPIELIIFFYWVVMTISPYIQELLLQEELVSPVSAAVMNTHFDRACHIEQYFTQQHGGWPQWEERLI